MRILHITPDYYPAMGGGEIHIKELSERLARRGHDVTVLALNSRGLSDGSRLRPREVVNRVKVVRLTVRSRFTIVSSAYVGLTDFSGSSSALMQQRWWR